MNTEFLHSVSLSVICVGKEAAAGWFARYGGTCCLCCLCRSNAPTALRTSMSRLVNHGSRATFGHIPWDRAELSRAIGVEQRGIKPRPSLLAMSHSQKCKNKVDTNCLHVSTGCFRMTQGFPGEGFNWRRHRMKTNAPKHSCLMKQPTTAMRKLK